MNRILIVGEHAQGKLNVSTAKCVNCAKALPEAQIDVVLLGSDLSAVAAQAAALEGVHKVLTVERAENAEPLAAVFAPQIAALGKTYSHVFGPSTTYGKDLVPRVAALLGVGQISDIMAVES